MGWVSDDVLIELVKLSRDVLAERRETSDVLTRLTGRIDGLSAKIGDVLNYCAEIRGDVGDLREAMMAGIAELKTAISDLKRENAEIKEFISTKAAELAEKTAKVEELLARVAELEPNQITEELKADIAAATADVRGVVDDLNTFTPNIEPEPEPPIEDEPEPQP